MILKKSCERLERIMQIDIDPHILKKMAINHEKFDAESKKVMQHFLAAQKAVSENEALLEFIVKEYEKKGK